MRSYKSPATTGLFIFSFIFLTSCTSNYQKLSTKPVVKVNDHVLSTKEFSNQIARKLKDLDALTAKDPSTVLRTKESLIRTFIVRGLTLDWARANSITIAEKDLDLIFTKYHRLTKVVEGSGVGLYLVNEIVKNAGGKITVESELGKGSQFRIYLKLEPQV